VSYVQPHYIRRNDSSRVPERYVFLDAEANRERDKKGEIQTWSLAVAKFSTFTRTGSIQSHRLRFDTPLELWRAISAFTRNKRRTVVYAHNLNYDLRISQCLTSLTGMGWTLQDMRLDGRGSWSRWSRQSASLLLCDSASIFPVKLQRLAIELGMKKLPLPPCKEREALFLRCEQDVEILSTGMIEYIKWLRTGAVGNWQMTGASQSWSHFRHSLMPYPILVHGNEIARAAERAAMHAGRAEAWRWGNIKREKIWEYDWSNSYPRIARDCALPQSLFGTLTGPSIETLETQWAKYCVLAEVEVTTNTPCVPTQYDGRTIWPTGSFRTTLWDPELRLLREAKATIRVFRAWLYKRAPILKDWAEWVLSSLHETEGSVEPWKKLILKHWSRSLIGRFGMRYRSWEYFADSPTSDIRISMLYDSDTGVTSELMQCGTKIFKLGEYQEINDGCPQITGYIMSEARAKLWRVAESTGHDDVYYMDTDSLIVNHKGHMHIQQQAGNRDYDGLRSKATYLSAHIYGPRSFVAGGKPTVSGLSKQATSIQPNVWQSEIWRGCKESIARGEYDRVTILLRNFTLRYNQHRRAFSNNGRTVPYQLPQYIPATGYVRPRTRTERAVLNGYPAMLTRSTAAKRGTQFERRRKDVPVL
jgi:hypothetical protein